MDKDTERFFKSRMEVGFGIEEKIALKAAEETPGFKGEGK
jgi:hypothetical protein